MFGVNVKSYGGRTFKPWRVPTRSGEPRFLLARISKSCHEQGEFLLPIHTSVLKERRGFSRFSDSTLFLNSHVTILRRVKIQASTFADSIGEIWAPGTLWIADCTIRLYLPLY